MSALHAGCAVYVARIVDRAVEVRMYRVVELVPAARLVTVHSGEAREIQAWRTYSRDDVHLTHIDAIRALAAETGAAASEAQHIAAMVDSLYVAEKNR